MPERKSSADQGNNRGDVNTASTSYQEQPTNNEASTCSEDVLAKHRILNSKYTHFHVVVFLITFLGYAIMHANRKSFSNVKVLISEEWTPSFDNGTERAKQPDWLWNSRRLFPGAEDDSCKTFLGTLDTVFMVSYAVGLFVSGPLGDRVNLRFVLCGGMWLTSVTIVLFACVPEWIGLYRIYWYVPFWVANGLFQSTGWPAVVAIMGNWFGKSHRGLIFGFWSANASVGNIFGSLIVAAFVEDGYELAMLVPAVMLFGSACVIFTGLVVSPNEISPNNDNATPRKDSSIPDATNNSYNSTNEAIPPQSAPPRLQRSSSFGQLATEPKPDPEVVPVLVSATQQSANVVSYASTAPVAAGQPTSCLMPSMTTTKPVGFFEALLLPGVIVYSVAYACLKLVNYSFFFWLPYYLNRSFHWSQAVADNLSVWYDVGGIIGGILGGVVSDRLRRSPVMAVMLLLAVPILIVFKELPDDQFMNAFVLVVLGFFIGGVANILSAAVCADLGRHPKLRGDTSALSTVTGILDGTGSVGAAIGQLLIPVLEHNLGWDAVFYMFIICTVLTACCISPIVYHEMKEACGEGCRCCFRRGDPERRTLVVHENEQ